MAPSPQKNRTADTADMAQDPRATAINRQMKARRGKASAIPETKPAAPARVRVPPAHPDPSRTEFEAAERRAAEMSDIARQAERWGVGFDLPRALKSRMSCDEARRQVQEARAAADEALVTSCTPTHSTAKASSDAENWNRAVARAAERAGLKMGSGR